ncbi:MAG: diguanylate cyclase domain-containing protein [Gammaproteobacteria bacterium]
MSTDKPLVLVADDDEIVREMLRETLLAAGFEVVTADNGQRAMDLFDARRPDIALLDVVMPVRDGLQVCTHIRTDARGEHTPILIITARTSLSMIHEAYRAGASDVLLKPINWMGLLQRLHGQLRAAESMRDIQTYSARLRALSNAAPDLTLRLSLDGTVIDASTSMNSGWEEQTYRLVGHPISALMPAETDQTLKTDIRRAIETGMDQQFQYQTMVGETLRSFEIRLHPSVDNEIIALVFDITERLSARDALYTMLYADPLTGWVNRRVGLLQLAQVLQSSRRRQRETAVLCVNVDHFRRINELYGHEVGDTVLRELAQRLDHLLRHSDILSRPMEGADPNQHPGRGGDEFILVLTDLHNAFENTPRAVERILETTGAPIEVDGNSLNIKLSIGIAQFPQDGDDALDLVNKATRAMKEAKLGGRNQVVYHADLEQASGVSDTASSEQSEGDD